MKWIKNLENLTEYIFSNKERFSKKHLNKIDAIKPRELYNNVCNQIAENLKDYGYIYSKSQNKLKLESDDKKYSLIIQFYSNRNNVAGQYVELTSSFHIKSKELKKFTKKKPLLNFSPEIIFGADFGKLIAKDKGSLIWNLAKKNDYEKSISIITKIAKTELKKIFNELQNNDLIIEKINNENFNLRNPIVTVQYLLMNGEIEIAERFLSNLLNHQKNLENYLKTKKEFAIKPKPKEYVHGMGYGHEIALMEAEYDLKIKVPNNQ
jgi:hypothetical protein